MENPPSRLEKLIDITKEILESKYFSAECAFLSGSIVRGKGKLFTIGKPARIIELTEELLQPHGVFLFEGSRLDAPGDWKKSIEKY